MGDSEDDDILSLRSALLVGPVSERPHPGGKLGRAREEAGS